MDKDPAVMENAEPMENSQSESQEIERLMKEQNEIAEFLASAIFRMSKIVEKKSSKRGQRPEKTDRMCQAVKMMVLKHKKQAYKLARIAQGAVQEREVETLAAPSLQLQENGSISVSDYLQARGSKRIPSYQPWKQTAAIFRHLTVQGEDSGFADHRRLPSAKSHGESCHFPIEEIELFQTAIDLSLVENEEQKDQVLLAADGKDSIRLFL